MSEWTVETPRRKETDMDSLIGKTIVAAEEASQHDWIESWRVTCSDGSVFEVTANGAAYCSAYLTVREVK